MYDYVTNQFGDIAMSWPCPSALSKLSNLEQLVELFQIPRTEPLARLYLVNKPK